MTDETEYIEVTGARVHNLKNINVRIPRYQLSVITGLSGSGKSSLAFDTIFAEGQRRYMDTFSSYARGFIGQMQRPDVDKISGLSPVISIDQKTTQKNPRSTVGTVTEVYDYLRLLFARAGKAYSWKTGEVMTQMTDEEMVDIISREYRNKRILLLAPLVVNRKGHYKELFESTRRKGFVYVRIDGVTQELVPGMKLDRYQNHTIEVVVDRLQVHEADEDSLRRLRQSADKALTIGNGVMLLVEADEPQKAPRYFSRQLMDVASGLSYQAPAPHSFSFNSPSGWCPVCKGLGKVLESKAAGQQPDADNEDRFAEALHDDTNWFQRMVELAGQEAEEEEESEDRWVICPACEGKRLNKEALSYRLTDKNIADLAEMDIDVLLPWLQALAKANNTALDTKQRAIAEPILKEIIGRLKFMESVGLGYLSLSRSSESLSGGESQRIRLATQIGSQLVNVLYILDEPSIGLHQRDNQRLIDSLKELRDMHNSVIVVEHDEQIMRQADYIVDIGPKAGRLGGEVVFAGTPAQMLQADTLTAKYLRQELTSDSSDPSDKSAPSASLVLTGCQGNNLKNVTVRIPLGQMVGVTGVSGSGKSTLINQTLYPILSQLFYRSLTAPLPYEDIRVEDCKSPIKNPATRNSEEAKHNIRQYIDKVIAVDQSPIGRTPRSNPATYTNVFNDIRELFAQLPDSKIRGWKQGRFSFNAKGGRCEECGGNGYKTIRMHFLPDVFVACEACGGGRYNRETLEVKFKGKTIADVLDMTVNQAVDFFAAQPQILRKIKTIQEVGLGYLKLGQSSTTLSGGESQRIKLATELARPATGKTLYILDEPTTGLHFEDIRVLNNVLRRLVNKGNTVLVIEHNPDVIKACDYLIDLGPEGGRNGGQIVATGSLADLQANPASLTGKYI